MFAVAAGLTAIADRTLSGSLYAVISPTIILGVGALSGAWKYIETHRHTTSY